MQLSFVHSVQSEWLKKRRSLASWIVIIGGFFTPTIIVIARLVNHDKLVAIYSDERFWNILWRTSWESVAIFLLPMGVILATSLITQLEHRNNTWKQLHTVPLTLTTIFFSKFTVIMSMLLQFFALFNIGMYLSALIPYLIVSDVPYPKAQIPYQEFILENTFYIIGCLPMVALQYLLGLKFKNFLVPIGAGFLMWIGALGMLTTRYGFAIPYSYTIYEYLGGESPRKSFIPDMNLHYMALGYFVLFTAVGYLLYIKKKDKG